MPIGRVSPLKEEKMKKVCCMLLLGLTLVAWTQAYAYKDHDFQIWNTDAEEFKINKDSKITLEEEFRWGKNAGEFFYHHYDAGYSYSLKKWLAVGGGYRHVYELKNRKFKAENEPYLTATLSGEKKGFVFESRSRMEYRQFRYQDDTWRYRNKFTLKLPWKFTELKIQPYLADELFLGFGNSATELSQNRFYAGFGASLTKNFKTELYYLLVSTKNSGKWTDANVFGTKLKLSF